MSKETGSQLLDWPCHRAVSGGFIDTGLDSNVYLYDRYVIKAYKQVSVGFSFFADQNREIFYSNIMNKAAKFAEENYLTIKFPNIKKELFLRINPVLDVRLCDCGLIESLSSFIPGKSLNGYPYDFDFKELSGVLEQTGLFFNEKLGIKGINIIPSNVKRVGGDTLVVTDLCADILDLKKVQLFT